MYSSSANNGEWYITVVDASVVKGFDMFSKSDLYVQVKFGDKLFKTKVAKNQESPVWNETFAFPFQSQSNVELKVADDDLFKDDTITVAHITSAQFPTFGEEKEYSIPLSYNNKDIGILHIRIRNSGNNMMSNNNQYSTASSSHAMGNMDAGGYNATILGGHSYHTSPNITNYLNTSSDIRSSNGGDYSHNYDNHNNMNTMNTMNTSYNNMGTSTMLPDINVANSRVIYHNVTEQRFTDTNLSSNVQHNEHIIPVTYHHNNTPNHNNNMQSTSMTTSTLPTSISTAGTSTTLPPPVNAVPMAATAAALPTAMAPATTEIVKTHRSKKSRKVHLPEKHHHYEDGYTSSSSESSNEGEKRRAAQGQLGNSNTTTTTTTTNAY